MRGSQPAARRIMRDESRATVFLLGGLVSDLAVAPFGKLGAKVGNCFLCKRPGEGAGFAC